MSGSLIFAAFHGGLRPAWLLAIAGFAFSTSATPGPNNTMLATSGANFGFMRTVPHMLGVMIGMPVMLAVVALGASAPLHAWPLLHGTLRWTGILYLLWLAWHIATMPPPQPGMASTNQGERRPQSFLGAASFQLINPKAWITIGSATVAYTVPGADILTQVLIMTLIFLIITPVSVAFWTMLGVGAAAFLPTPRSLRVFNIGMATILAASIVPLIYEHF